MMTISKDAQQNAICEKIKNMHETADMLINPP
jgi:hypothetical protein